jgi:hypothetical protein
MVRRLSSSSSGSDGSILGVWGWALIGDKSPLCETGDRLLRVETGEESLDLEGGEITLNLETGDISILDTGEKGREAIVDASSNELMGRTLAQETFGAAYLRSGVLRRSIRSDGRGWGKPGLKGRGKRGRGGCSEAMKDGCFRGLLGLRGGGLQADSGLSEDELGTGLREGVRSAS